MRIAVAVHFTAPQGGLHDNVRATVHFLRAHRHEPVVFCPPGPFAAELQAAGIAVHTTAFDAMLRLLDEAVTLGPFDLVHAHPGLSRKFGLHLAHRLGCPFLLTLHGRWFNAVHTYAHRCARIVVVSPAIRDELLRVLPAAFAARVDVVPNGVTTLPPKPRWTVARRTVALCVRWLRRPALRVVVPSRFDGDKRRLTDFLLALWKLQACAGADARAVQWDVAGTGSDLPELQAAATALGAALGRPTVRFHGWLGHRALDALYDACDLAFAPGRSALDAMARGLPLVAVGSAGCAGLAEPGALAALAHANFGGFGLHRQASPEEVWTDLVRLARRPTEWVALARASEAFVRREFDDAAHQRRLLALYEEARLHTADAAPHA